MPLILKVVAFAINMLIVASCGWLLRLYWPQRWPYIWWYGLLVGLTISSVYTMLTDLAWVLGYIETETFVSLRVIGTRGLILFGLLYAVDWHVRQSRKGVT